MSNVRYRYSDNTLESKPYVYHQQGKVFIAHDVKAGETVEMHNVKKTFVLTGIIHEGATISYSGDGNGNLMIQGEVQENVTVRYSGSGNLFFKEQPPKSVVDKLDTTSTEPEQKVQIYIAGTPLNIKSNKLGSNMVTGGSSPTAPKATVDEIDGQPKSKVGVAVNGNDVQIIMTPPSPTTPLFSNSDLKLTGYAGTTFGGSGKIPEDEEESCCPSFRPGGCAVL